MRIRDFQREDCGSILKIYQEGIDTGHATFEAKAPMTIDAWLDNRVAEAVLVAVNDGTVLGFAALSPSSSRCVYRGVCEVSVYVTERARGQGIGHALLKALVNRSEKLNIWTLTAGIFPENAASIELHHSLGFETLGVRKALGKMTYGPMAGRWRDVVLLERRSEIAGID